MQQKPSIDILERYLAGQATREERRLVEQWYEASGEADFREDKVSPQVGEEMFRKIKSAVGLGAKVVRMPVRWRAAAAAVALVALVAAGVWVGQNFHQPSVAHVPTRSVLPPAREIGPGGDRAELILADGSVVDLDSARSGSVASQGTVKVVKLADGRLQYNTGRAPGGGELFNIVRTPNGGQYRLVLPDGSAVWLNAASSLRFPVAFTGSVRRVELTGEGYFEVKHDESRPFKVVAGEGGKNMEVQVLGTSFNVNVYDNEPVKTVTVVTGKVAVNKPGTARGVLLTPGQEALNTQGDLVRREGADVDQAIAWKNGLFQFNSEDIAAILRQIARWYDVEVVFPEGVPAGRITGKVGRDMNLAEVLEVLQLSGVKFRVEDRSIVVLK